MLRPKLRSNETEQEVHDYLDDYFSRNDSFVSDNDRLSRFHRSYVRKNKGKFVIKKEYERITGQPIYRWGQKQGTQFRNRRGAEHIGWGGSITYANWIINKVA